LTGAFAVLAVGCAMSILTFLAEIIIFLKKESDKKCTVVLAKGGGDKILKS
jgi:hypothetical protein